MTELIKKLLSSIRKYWCKHEFKGSDMMYRNKKGVVKWQCYKCRKEFEGECGLDILTNGKCAGGWDDKSPDIITINK